MTQKQHTQTPDAAPRALASGIPVYCAYDEIVPIEQLKPNPKNPNKHPQEQIEKLGTIIRGNGWRNPITVSSRSGLIVKGHGRLLTAELEELKEVPVEYQNYESEEAELADLTADNRIAELAEIDSKILADVFADIDTGAIDFELSGYSEEEYKDLATALSEAVHNEINDPDDVPDVEETREPITKQGDIWILGGRHRLMCGDSTDNKAVELLMDGNRADLVFTDPPYGMNAVSKSGVLSKRYKTDIMNDESNEVAMKSFVLAKTMFETSKQVWWGANYYTECLPSSECWLVWDKNNGASDQTDCELAWANFRSVVRQFTIASEKINRVHPPQKPVKLIQQIFDKFDQDGSCKIIVDLFGGSGSTLIACELLGRICYTMELDPKYVDVIVKRYIRTTGDNNIKCIRNGEELPHKEIANIFND